MRGRSPTGGASGGICSVSRPSPRWRRCAATCNSSRARRGAGSRQSAQAADYREMAAVMRTLILVAALGTLVGVKTAAPKAAPTARDQTLFGLNAPSLDALDDAESTLGARAAIVGTYADWAHTPDFP